MMDKKILLLSAASIATFLLIQTSKKKRQRSMWSRAWLQKRQEGRGVLSMVETELKDSDSEKYRQFLRMCEPQFDELLELIREDITKQDTILRKSISAEYRLALTLRFLASGESYRSLMFSTRIHESTISIIVPEVCQVIYNKLKDEYMKMPQTVNEWQQVANAFENLWQFPMCLGAIDGKHINFRAPRSSGSYYYNYKGQFSIVLMAVANAEYKFLYINVGVNGRMSDGGVFRESSLKKAMERNLLNFPPDQNLPRSNSGVPYVFVCDDAFPLSERIMKPYPSRNLSNDKRIFNYRLSRARRVIENAFGIMSNRFRVLLSTINLGPDKVETITLACCVLHNFLISKNSSYAESETESINPRLNNLNQLQGGNRPAEMALSVRDKFKNYFMNEGSVPWQNKCLT
ncbi:uncharacterized protein LOC114327552 [Diabrotica virgifera virgifera]|uniref:DDE Tnp4 domain-containing protein n=1 Tax=Diabrotica virgifera virgifera TaxID=50390 RepID=A0ABM5IG66_DIAVI|nr:uncharacterized protein LOC114327552 [Diabrotica virgifera virgifera]